MGALNDFSPHEVIVHSSPEGLADEVAAIVKLTHQFKHGLVDSADLDPLATEDIPAFREAVEQAAPRFFHFAQAVKIRLLQGAMAVFVEKLGLEDLPLSQRRYGLFALGCLLGAPTATDPRQKRVLWDVKARRSPSDHFVTFSEHDREARFHTDTQYYANPERFFLLYAVRAARCGGGLNFFASGPRILRELGRSQAGYKAFNVLNSVTMPFRIPTTFAHGDEAEHTWAPVISAFPLLRYREDTIFDGEARFPDLPWREVKDALKAFHETATKLATNEMALPDDGAIFVNNHEALHARTAFKDPDRHLIRVRMHA